MANLEFALPVKGKSVGMPIEKEQPLTSSYMNNVRARDVLESRIRIGQRPALVKWGNGTQIGAAANPIVSMMTISTVA